MNTLTFKSGKFVIEDTDAKLRKKLNADPLWECGELDTYVTSSLRAAREFRDRADGIAESVFKRAFQEHYPSPSLPSLPFDPHQVDGLSWLLSRKRSYLAHAPGAGKTPQAVIGACLAKGPGGSLFIVPPSLATQWVAEIWKFTGWLGIFPAIGRITPAKDRDTIAWKADFMVCPDSMLSTPWVLEQLKRRKWKLIAVDEASRFKEPMTKRGRAFYGGLFQDARHTVFMDGSPLLNRPMELWAPTYALDPEAIDCMSQHDFGFRYCGATINERGNWEYKHSANEAELKERLQKDFMHVVTEDKLGHAERRRSIVFTDQNVLTAKDLAWERKHLRGIDPDEIDEEDSQGDLARHRKEIGLKKVPWILKRMRELLKNNEDEAHLLFGWHREVVQALHAGLDEFGFALVQGGIPMVERGKIFADFQSGKLRGIVGNIAAMGRGGNLQRADRVGFAEYSWTDEENVQCEKRASRRGREVSLPVRCDYYVAPGSFDERIMSANFTKRVRVKRIIG